MIEARFRTTTLAALLATAAAVVLSVPAAARADSAEWEAYSERAASPWPRIQEESGTLPDFMDDLTNPNKPKYGTRYGDALMGFALIQVGLREDDRELLEAGIRSITYATGPNRIWHPSNPQKVSVFEQWGVAGAYNALRVRLKSDPFFQEQRSQWEDWLRQQKTVRFGTGQEFSNHDLVEGVVAAELLRTGLRSDAPGAVLGSGRRLAESQMLELVNQTVPRVVGSRNPAFISDPPFLPAAYHALSFGLYAHLVSLLGDRASVKARIVMRRSGDGSWRMAAPDADQAGWGRSQELVFAYPAAAYGASIAAGLEDTSAEDAARYRAVAERSLGRLRAHYPITDRGQVPAPSITSSEPNLASRALEGYVGYPSMGGLALVFLNMALDEPASALDGPVAKLASDRNTEAIIGKGPGQFAVVRRGRIWFAVKASRLREGRLWSDVRYDLGLVLLKRQDDRGRWHDLIPHRPNTMERSFRDNVGPILRKGGSFPPAAPNIETTGSGGVLLRGYWYRKGRRPIRRGTWRFDPTTCGVAMTFSGNRRELFEMSYFFRGQPTKRGRTLGTATERLKSNVPFRVTYENRYASAMYAPLVRAHVFVRAPKSKRIRLETC